MKVYIIKLGVGFIESKLKRPNWQNHDLIIALIDLHDRFLNIVQEQFAQVAQFQNALKEAFQEIMNKEYYVSVLLARYCNDILKKGTKIDICNLENTMQHVAMLYGYIENKDIFECDFQQYLASRLLQDLSLSEQSERLMIAKLITAAGCHWTSKLEDMFADIYRSKQLTADFKKLHGNDYDVELNVSVCTRHAWPKSVVQHVQVKKPTAIESICNRFTSFYLSKYSKHCLSFQMDKEKAEVTVWFNKTTKKILVCSTYQMLILLLFNQQLTWTFKEIYEETGIPKEDCLIHCQSMSHPNIKVLRKAPN